MIIQEMGPLLNVIMDIISFVQITDFISHLQFATYIF